VIFAEEWTGDGAVEFPHVAIGIEYTVPEHRHGGLPEVGALHVPVKISH
jgi:hypothetical protein